MAKKPNTTTAGQGVLNAINQGRAAQSSGLPGRLAQAAGNNAPGQVGATPGQTGTMPAQGAMPPGQGGTAPGQNGGNPGQGGNVIYGTTDSDILTGTAGKDTIIALDGHDKIDAGAGNDTIDGGAGTDTVFFTGNMADYTWKVLNNGTVKVNGPDGNDMLTNIERLQFADGIIYLVPNIDPVAVADQATILEDATTTFLASDLLANDSDADGDPVTITNVLNATNGTVSLDVNGDIAFVPDANFSGTATFQYEIADGHGGFSTATVTVIVTAVADAPALVTTAALGNEDTAIALDIASQLTDVDGSESLALTINGVPAGATLSAGTMNADGSWSLLPADLAGLTMTPPLDYSGSIDLTVTATSTEASNGDTASTVAVLNVSVTAVADAPTLVTTAALGNEDTAIALDIASQLTDVDGSESLSLTIDGVPAGATLSAGTMNADGSWALLPGDLAGLTLTPPLDYNGAFDLTITAVSTEASNGDAASVSSTFTVTIAPVNDAPIAVADSAYAIADAGIMILGTHLLANDTDIEGDALSILSVASGIGGMVVLGADGNVQFMPDAGFTGNATFDYTITDSNGGTATATVTVEVLPGDNNAPIARDDLILGGMCNDTLTGTAGADIMAGGNGADTINAGAGNDTIFADATDTINGGSGTDSVIFTGSSGASLNLGASSIENVTGSSGGDTFDVSSVPSGTEWTINAGGGNDTINMGSSGGSTGGSTGGGSVSGGSGYDVANYGGGAGGYGFSWGDGNFYISGTSGTTTFTGVEQVNFGDLSIGFDADMKMSWCGILEDTPVIIPGMLLLANDTDPNGDPISIISVQDSLNGTVSLDANGDVLFSPAQDFNGWTTFTYTITDPSGLTDTATVTMYVKPVNDAPVANPDSAITLEDTAVTIVAAQLLANDSDVDGDVLTLSAVGNAIGGTVMLNTLGDVVFTPALNYNGAASFDYQVSDGNGGTATTTVAVTVSPVEDAPITQTDVFTMLEDGSITIQVAELLANDYDPDGDAISLTNIALNSTDGAMVLSADGLTISFTPSANFNGQTTFQYTVSDTNGNTTSETATINVTSVNDAPVITVFRHTCTPNTNGTYTVPEVCLLNAATDADGHALSVVNLSVNGGAGTLVNNGDGTWTYTPPSVWDGNMSVSYQVSDGVALSNEVVVESTTNTADFQVTLETGSISLDQAAVLATSGSTQVDGGGFTLSGVSGSDGGTATLNADGTLSFVRDPSFTGTGSFEVTATDASGNAVVWVVWLDCPPLGSGSGAMTSGGELSSVTTTAAGLHNIATASLTGGGYVLTWRASDGSDYGIYGQRYDAAGVAVGAVFRANTVTTYNQIDPSVTGLADGGFVISWQAGTSTTVHLINAQRYDANGVKVGSAFNITDFPVGVGESYLTALADGGFIVTWTTLGRDGSGYAVMARHYDASGTLVISDFQVNTTSLGSQRGSASTLLSDGSYIITWQSESLDGSSAAIVGRHYDAVGNALGGQFQVNTTAYSTQSMPDITAMQGGGFVVTWMSNFQDGSGYGIYGQRFDATSAPLGGEFQINSYTTSSQIYPTITGLTDGGFMAVWMSAGQDGSGYGVYGQRYDVNGAVVGAEFQVNDVTVGDQGYPVIETMANGDVVVTWVSGTTIVSKIYHFTPTDIVLVGTSLNDVLIGGTGNDIIDGLAGADTVVFTGNAADYTLTLNADGTTTVQDLRAGGDGIDTLSNIEFLQFADQSVALNAVQMHGDFVGGSQFQVNTYIGGAQEGSSITALSGGGYVVTWRSPQDGSGTGIYGQRYDALGVAAGREFKVNNYTWGQQGDAVVAGLLDGGFVVTWHSDNQDGNGYGIVARRYDALGTAVGFEVVVNSVTSGSQTYPSVTGLSDGGYVVTWNSSTWSGSVISGQRYSASGSKVGGEMLIATSNQPIHSSVTALTDGGFVVTWRSYLQDGSGLGVYGQRFSALGVALGPEFQVNTYTTYNQEQSSVAALADGGYVVMWQSYLQDGSAYGVYGQRFDRLGGQVGSEFRVNTYVNSDQINPSVTGLDDGGFLVTWESKFQDGSPYSIYAQRFNAMGVAMGAEFPVSDYTMGYQMNPSVTALSDGTIAVSWQSTGPTGSGWDIYVKTYTITPTGVLIKGTTMNDVLIGGAGDDVIDGNAGVDTAVFSGNAADYIVTTTPNGITVEDLRVGGDGIDTLINIEFLQFADQTVEMGAVTGIMIPKEGPGEVLMTSAYMAGSPAIAELTDGSYVITWMSARLYNSYRIYAQRYDANGTPMTAATVSGGISGGGHSLNPDITALQDGGYVITWDGPYGDNSNDVFLQQFDAAGVGVGSTLVNTTTQYGQRGSIIETLSDGSYIVGWTSISMSPTYSLDFMAQRYDAAGNAIGGEFTINTNTTNQQSGYAITALENGGFIAAWSSNAVEYSTRVLVSQLFDAAGNRVGGEFIVSDSGAYVSITALADGGFMLILAEDDPTIVGYDYDVYGQRYDAAGQPVGAKFQVNTYTISTQSNPTATMLADGDVMVTWQSTGQDGSFGGIYGQRVDVNGNKLGTEFRINDTTLNDQSGADVAVLSNGAIVVTWQGMYPRSGSIRGVYHKVYTPQYDGTVIEGSVISDVLIGDTGNDTLDGGAGDDTLTGGAGDDTYVLGRGDGQDTINNIGEGGSADVVSYAAGVNHDQLWFTHSGNDLVIGIIGTTDTVSVMDWYSGAVNQVSAIQTADGFALTNAAVQNLVTAMAGMTPPPVGQSNLTTAEHTTLDPVIVANWQ